MGQIVASMQAGKKQSKTQIPKAATTSLPNCYASSTKYYLHKKLVKSENRQTAYKSQPKMQSLPYISKMGDEY